MAFCPIVKEVHLGLKQSHGLINEQTGTKTVPVHTLCAVCTKGEVNVIDRFENIWYVDRDKVKFTFSQSFVSVHAFWVASRLESYNEA